MISSDSEVSPAAARQLQEMWEFKAVSERPLGPGWTAAFADWVNKFGFGRVADAVQMASAPRFADDGKRLPPDIRDVPKYAAVERADEREPGMKECYFTRGRMRLKYYYEEDDNEVLKLLRRAMRAGVSPVDHAQCHRRERYARGLLRCDGRR
jgi:hypothetical protein